MSALVTHFAYRMGAYEYLHSQGFSLVAGDDWISDCGLINARVRRVGSYDYRVEYIA